MSDILNDLLSFVDTDQLAYVEPPSEGLNKARLIQGDSSFEKDPALNQTVRYLGGIGLSMDGLNEDVVNQGTIVTVKSDNSSRDFIAFRSLEVVVLASSRIRRFYAEIDGNQRLACGTNQDGANARGWNGLACKSCEYFPKNYQGDKRDGCRATVAALCYIPELNHTAIFEFHGGSYMQATAWLDQVGKLARAFAQKPEVQVKSPGLARVNPWFFRTTLSAGPFEKGEKDLFQRLAYTKAEPPYQWDTLMNSPGVLAQVKAVWTELEPLWKQIYVDHNPNAVMALSSAEAVAAIASQSSAVAPPARQLESKVSVPAAPVGVPTPAVPVAIPTAVPALPAIPMPAAAPAMAAIPTGPAIPVVSAPAVPQAAIPHAPMPGVAVSTIALDDADVQPVTIPTGF